MIVMIKVIMTHKSSGRRGYVTKELVFNDKRHLENWKRKWFHKYDIDRFEIIKDTEAEARNTKAYVEAQENAMFERYNNDYYNF